MQVPELDVWGMDVLVTQLHFDDDHNEGRVVHSAMAVLEEAALDPVYLRYGGTRERGIVSGSRRPAKIADPRRRG